MTWPLVFGCGNDLLECMLADFAASAGGETTFGALLGGVLLVVFWIAQPRQSLVAPAVLLILLGGIAVPVLPGGLQNLAWAIIVVGIAGGFFAVAKRYVMDPGI
jgi:hypothetical protein